MSATAARAARDALERLLDTDAPALRASLPPGFPDAAEAYVALLLAANARLNLTRIVEPGEVARLHLLDALSALPLLDAAAPGRGSRWRWPDPRSAGCWSTPLGRRWMRWPPSSTSCACRT